MKFWQKLMNGWLEQKQTTVLSAALVITIANVCASFSGLLRNRLLTSRFFDTVLSREQYEAFLVAFQLPDLVYQLIILGALSAAFIPLFTQLRKQKSEEEAFKFTNIVMNILLLGFLVIAVVVFIFARPLTEWRTGVNFTSAQVDIVVNMTRAMLIAQLFFAISNFFTGMLQSSQKFIMPALAPIIYNLGIVVGTYALYPALGIYAAGVGVLIGAFLHMAIQYPSVKKIQWRYRWQWNINFPKVKTLFKLMPARLMTIGVSELQVLSLGFFATQIGNLSFVIINYASSIITLPTRFFGVPIAQATLPFLSSKTSEADRETYRMMIVQSLNQVSFMAVPASVLILILRIPIVRLIYGARNFPWDTTISMGRVVAILALIIGMRSVTPLLTRAFHALNNTAKPFWISLASTAVFVVGCMAVTFSESPNRLYGLAIVMAVVAALECILHIVMLHRFAGRILRKGLVYPQLKILGAGVLMAIALYIPFKLLDDVVFDTTRVLPLLGLTVVTSAVGFAVYVGFCAMLRLRELTLLTKAVRLLSKNKLVKTSSPIENMVTDVNS
ncbi:polysaccharide biosynthesis C-terminal domain-containing protein [Microgenomates group bacterium]|nr:polysaccharide biosynthesis C-terminal domain-containing protein [Microgenomates group bacterium]